MKIRDLSIHKYGWTLRIYYAVTCYYTGEILKSLTDIGCPDTVLHRVLGIWKSVKWIRDSPTPTRSIGKVSS